MRRRTGPRAKPRGGSSYSFFGSGSGSGDRNNNNNNNNNNETNISDSVSESQQEQQHEHEQQQEQQSSQDDDHGQKVVGERDFEEQQEEEQQEEQQEEGVLKDVANPSSSSSSSLSSSKQQQQQQQEREYESTMTTMTMRQQQQQQFQQHHYEDSMTGGAVSIEPSAMEMEKKHDDYYRGESVSGDQQQQQQQQHHHHHHIIRGSTGGTVAVEAGGSIGGKSSIGGGGSQNHPRHHHQQQQPNRRRSGRRRALLSWSSFSSRLFRKVKVEEDDEERAARLYDRFFAYALLALVVLSAWGLLFGGIRRSTRQLMHVPGIPQLLGMAPRVYNGRYVVFVTRSNGGSILHLHESSYSSSYSALSADSSYSSYSGIGPGHVDFVPAAAAASNDDDGDKNSHAPPPTTKVETLVRMGQSSESAVEALRRAQSGFPPHAANYGWVKVDVVTAMKRDAHFNFRNDAPEVPSHWYGIALNWDEPGWAFLPDEVYAQTLVDKNSRLRWDHIGHYASSRAVPGWPYDPHQTDDATTIPLDFFQTKAAFVDLTFPSSQPPVAIELHHGHRMFDALTPELLYDASIAAGSYLTRSVHLGRRRPRIPTHATNGDNNDNNNENEGNNVRGKMVYRYLPRSGTEPDEYGLTRHSGTAFAMARLYGFLSHHHRRPPARHGGHYGFDSLPTYQRHLGEATGRALDYVASQVVDCPPPYDYVERGHPELLHFDDHHAADSSSSSSSSWRGLHRPNSDGRPAGSPYAFPSRCVVDEVFKGKRWTQLGVTSLSLLAMVEYMDVHDGGFGATNGAGRRFLEHARAIANWICASQRPDGSFVQSQQIDTNRLNERSYVLYFPGEAAYALSKLVNLVRRHRNHPYVARLLRKSDNNNNNNKNDNNNNNKKNDNNDRRKEGQDDEDDHEGPFVSLWKTTAIRAVRRVIQDDHNTTDADFVNDHWMMYAISEMELWWKEKRTNDHDRDRDDAHKEKDRDDALRFVVRTARMANKRQSVPPSNPSVPLASLPVPSFDDRSSSSSSSSSEGTKDDRNSSSSSDSNNGEDDQEGDDDEADGASAEDENRDRFGLYKDKPSSTATATKSEGLCATYELVVRSAQKKSTRKAGGRNDDLGVDLGTVKEWMWNSVNYGIRYQLQTQMMPEQAMYLKDPLRIVGAFGNSIYDKSTRNDFTQHNMASLLCLVGLLERHPNGPASNGIAPASASAAS